MKDHPQHQHLTTHLFLQVAVERLDQVLPELLLLLSGRFHLRLSLGQYLKRLLVVPLCLPLLGHKSTAAPSPAVVGSTVEGGRAWNIDRRTTTFKRNKHSS